MNKLWQRINNEVIKSKKTYLFLLIMLIIGIICGSLFVTVLDEGDNSIVTDQLVSFFKKIKSNDINFLLAFKNSISSNLIQVLLIWLLGISIIGIPIIIFGVFMKGFIIGFSVVAIIAKYKFIGILGGLTYIFPHLLLSTIVILILSCYALYFSFNLFWGIIQKKVINFKDVINRYAMILLWSMMFMFLSSFLESFISPYIIKIFLTFVKL